MGVQLGGDITTDENILLSNGVSSFQGVSRHTIDASITAVGYEPSIVWYPYRYLSIGAGITAGFIVNSTFSQREDLIQPTGRGTFENGTRSRNTTDNAELPSMESAYFLSSLRLAYSVPLNRDRTMFLTPEISFSQGFGDISRAAPWKVNRFQAGVGFRLALSDDFPRVISSPEVVPVYPKEIEEIREELNQPVVDYVLAANISAVEGLYDDGRVEVNPTITIEEFQRTITKSLLPRVFFDENSADFPSRYNQISSSERRIFSLNTIAQKSTEDMYSDILNILGSRLADNPTATITLTGCNDGSKREIAENIAEERALAIKDYLTDVWLIESDRIITQKRNLPEFFAEPSDNSEKISADAENRRVEISASDPSILADIASRSIRRTVAPQQLRFSTESMAQQDVSSWAMTVFQGEPIITEYGVGDLPEKITIPITGKNTPTAQEELSYILELYDEDSRFEIRPRFIPVEYQSVKEKRQGSMEDIFYDDFIVILFEYNQMELGDRNRTQLMQLAEQIKQASSIRVLGSTDAIGADDYNAELAKKRAEGIAAFLSEMMDISSDKITVDFQQEALYDNLLPEGRAYNRHVRIELVTTK
jgi:outer membrane protein OmpA-like peptidoglycan-associated protein